MKPVTNFFANALTFAVPVNATDANFPFPDLPSLRNKKVQGLQLAGQGSTTWIDGKQVLTGAPIDRLLLTVQDRQSFNFVDRVPLRFFDYLQFGQNWKYFLPSRGVYWEACFLQIPQGSALLPNNNQVVLMVAFYE